MTTQHCPISLLMSVDRLQSICGRVSTISTHQKIPNAKPCDWDVFSMGPWEKTRSPEVTLKKSTETHAPKILSGSLTVTALEKK